MLKSTYQPSPKVAAPLPLQPGWTEHKAPTGHTYYYNTETKVSTYTRPSAPAAPLQLAPLPDSSASFYQYQSIPSISNPQVANAFLAQYNAQQASPDSRGGFGHGARGGADSRPRSQPLDKPRESAAIPRCEPWLLVNTKYGRRFVYNPDKKASYWRIPEKLKAGILELDQARIHNKVAQLQKDDSKEPQPTLATSRAIETGGSTGENPEADDSSEYEEVEVTDDEQDGIDGDEKHPNKRQRTEELADDAPVEFSEADIAFQLQAMGGGYGLDTEDYDDDVDAAEEEPFSEEDAAALFKDLLDDFKINPYSPWEELIEKGQIIEDPRYTVLTTMKARKEIWQEWSKDRIKELRELRAKEEKKDPRISYMALLHEKATPKLFWPEFKRKYRKEAPMSDPYLKDKDREKWYREHVSRLKMPQSTLKTDLAALLRSLPLSVLNNKTMISHVPPQLLVDTRYISLPADVRDSLVEAYVQTLGPPPQTPNPPDEEDQAIQKAREAKERREKALQDREKAVAEQKRRQQKDIEIGKARLREEEREIQMAMQVGKRGLQSQLASIPK